MTLTCTYVCRGETYDIQGLSHLFHAKGRVATLYDGVLYVAPVINEEDQDLQHHHSFFFFPYGCAVFWGASEKEIESYLTLADPYLTKSLTQPMIDHVSYAYAEETSIAHKTDQFIVEKEDPLILLSFSYCLSQSVKLSVFEESINRLLQKTKHLPEEMAQYGKTFLSKRQLSQRTGSLFAQRHAINLHNDLLDTPEFFWRYSAYESYYQKGIAYLEIRRRTHILHQRLSVVEELYKTLSYEINHVHSSRLEWIIIYLIITEVVLCLLKDVLKIL